jgi:hypothetical protein
MPYVPVPPSAARLYQWIFLNHDSIDKYSRDILHVSEVKLLPVRPPNPPAMTCDWMLLSSYLSDNAATQQVGSGGYIADLYAESAKFEPRLGHLFRFSMIFLTPSTQTAGWYFKLGHNRYIPRHFQFIITT